MNGTTTLSDWLTEATAELSQLAHIDSPSLDAQLLLSYVTGHARSVLYTWPEKTLTAAQWQALQTALDRRSSGEPIAYIVGSKAFYSVELTVSPAVLIPRPETEQLVTLALAECEKHHHSNKPLRVLDAGTGSGAIVIALAFELINTNLQHLVSLTASDLSLDALQIAQANAERIVPGAITFVQSDWLDAFEENSVDVVISNPPYIEADDPHLNDANLLHEPFMALASGEDGLQAIKTLIKQCLSVGASNALLMIEHGFNQASAIQQLLQNAGYSNIQTHKDLQGLNRITSANAPKKPDDNSA